MYMLRIIKLLVCRRSLQGGFNNLDHPESLYFNENPTIIFNTMVVEF